MGVPVFLMFQDSDVCRSAVQLAFQVSSKVTKETIDVPGRIFAIQFFGVQSECKENAEPVRFCKLSDGLAIPIGLAVSAAWTVPALARYSDKFGQGGNVRRETSQRQLSTPAKPVWISWAVAIILYCVK